MTFHHVFKIGAYKKEQVDVENCHRASRLIKRVIFDIGWNRKGDFIRIQRDILKGF